MSAQTWTVTKAAIQLFDRGLMVWRSDTDYIWALITDGRARRALGFASADYSKLPDNPHQELGRLMPENGFGKVWGNNFRVRDALGYPKMVERSVESMSVWSEDGTIYLEQPDKSVIQINADNTWSEGPASVPPPAPEEPRPPIITEPDPPPAPGEYITVAEYQAGMDKLRADLMAHMTEILNAHIAASLTLDEVMSEVVAEASRRWKPLPVTSMQLLPPSAIERIG